MAYLARQTLRNIYFTQKYHPLDLNNKKASTIALMRLVGS